MTGKALLFALLAIGLVGLPSASSAEIYHHVHHRSPDAIAAAQWYIDHMDCKDYGREGACQVDCEHHSPAYRCRSVTLVGAGG